MTEVKSATSILIQFVILKRMSIHTKLSRPVGTANGSVYHYYLYSADHKVKVKCVTSRLT